MSVNDEDRRAAAFAVLDQRPAVGGKAATRAPCNNGNRRIAADLVELARSRREISRRVNHARSWRFIWRGLRFTIRSSAGRAGSFALAASRARDVPSTRVTQCYHRAIHQAVA